MDQFSPPPNVIVNFSIFSDGILRILLYPQSLILVNFCFTQQVINGNYFLQAPSLLMKDFYYYKLKPINNPTSSLLSGIKPFLYCFRLFPSSHYPCLSWTQRIFQAIFFYVNLSSWCWLFCLSKNNYFINFRTFYQLHCIVEQLQECSSIHPALRNFHIFFLILQFTLLWNFFEMTTTSSTILPRNFFRKNSLTTLPWKKVWILMKKLFLIWMKFTLQGVRAHWGISFDVSVRNKTLHQKI